MTAIWLDLYPYHRASLSRWRCSEAGNSVPLLPNMLTRSEVYPNRKMTVSTFSNMLSQLRIVPWQKKNWLNFYTLQHVTLTFTFYHDGNLTQFLHSSVCFPVIFFDRKLAQFLYFRKSFSSVKCSVTENRSSFYIFHVLPRCSVLSDRKLAQFLHFPTCFLVVKCSLTANWLGFNAEANWIIFCTNKQLFHRQESQIPPSSKTTRRKVL